MKIENKTQGAALTIFFCFLVLFFGSPFIFDNSDDNFIFFPIFGGYNQSNPF